MRELYADFLIKLLAVRFGNGPGPDIVLKDPELTLHLKSLAALWPQRPKILVIVRDPRDAVASLMAVRRRAGEEITVAAALSTVFPYFNAARSAQGCAGLRCLTVRYEDLVRFDVQTWNKLGDHLGFTPSKEGFIGVRSAIDREDPFWTPLYETGISAQRMTAWGEMLTPDEASHVEETMGGFFLAFGYDA